MVKFAKTTHPSFAQNGKATAAAGSRLLWIAKLRKRNWRFGDWAEFCVIFMRAHNFLSCWKEGGMTILNTTYFSQFHITSPNFSQACFDGALAAKKKSRWASACFHPAKMEISCHPCQRRNWLHASTTMITFSHFDLKLFLCALKIGFLIVHYSLQCLWNFWHP